MKKRSFFFKEYLTHFILIVVAFALAGSVFYHQMASYAPRAKQTELKTTVQSLAEQSKVMQGTDSDVIRELYMLSIARIAKEDELILLCGHYEGVDQRALDLCIDEEISIGDYVLTGGELGAMVLVDCVARLVPGVLGCEESAQTESFSSGLLEYPQYTRPREFEGLTVPEPLLNGNHAHIVDWQLSESLYITLRRRPEMAKAYLDGRKFTRHQQKVVDAVFDRIREEDEAAKAQTEEQP